MQGDRAAVQAVLDQVRAEGRTVLTAPEGKQVCEAYGIPVPKEGLATSVSEAARLAQDIGYPIVLKIVSTAPPGRASAAEAASRPGGHRWCHH